MTQPYRPTIKGPWQQVVPSNVPYSVNFEGGGPPHNIVTAWPGCTYCDLSTGIQYIKVGTSDNQGWLVSGAGCGVEGGSGTGTASIYYGANSPVNTLIAQRPAVYYQSNGSVYLKQNSTLDAAGWVAIIEGPQ